MSSIRSSEIGDLDHLPRELGEIVVMFNNEEAFTR